MIPLAVAERPFFGWGSWAVDKDLKFTFLRAEILNFENVYNTEYDNSKFYIPAHSLIGSVWIWSGFLGFLVIIWFLRIIWVNSLRLLESRSPFLPVMIFLILNVFWHYFFSPPMLVRLNYPVTLAALIVLTKINSKNRKN